MSETLFLIKYGEIALKKRNRGAFVRSLKDTIRAKLPGLQFSVYETFHRVFVRCQPSDAVAVAAALARTFGIVSFCEAVPADLEITAIEQAALALVKDFLARNLGTRFKAEVRRAEKGFPLTSYEIACRLGDVLLDRFPELKVDVHTPDWVLSVEIRERAYLYGPSTDGPYGLPSGSSGRGLLLLSGGIDSPVAGWMMAKRGMALRRRVFPLGAIHLRKGARKGGDARPEARRLGSRHRAPRRPLHPRAGAHQGEVEGGGDHAPPARVHDAVRHAPGGENRGDVPGDG